MRTVVFGRLMFSPNESELQHDVWSHAFLRVEVSQQYVSLKIILCMVVCEAVWNQAQKVCSVQFSSVQDGIYVLGKAQMRSTPSLGSFPNVAHWNSSNVGLIAWRWPFLVPSRKHRWALPLFTPQGVLILLLLPQSLVTGQSGLLDGRCHTLKVLPDHPRASGIQSSISPTASAFSNEGRVCGEGLHQMFQLLSLLFQD